jgi:hypothetical protein
MTGGETRAQKTISAFKYTNTEDLKFVSNDNKCKLSFLNEFNKEIFDRYNFFSSGMSTAIYKISINDDNNYFPDYKNTPLIMRLYKSDLLSNGYLNDFINKYNDDICKPFLKDHIIDILYFGEIIKDGISFTYIICPIYDTEPLLNNKLSFVQKKNYLNSVVKLLNNLSENKIVINDFKIANISINSQGEIIVIDYDLDTFGEKFGNCEYKQNNGTKGCKPYHIGLSQIIYQLFILGKTDNIPQIIERYDKLFISKELINGNKVINDDFDKKKYNEIIQTCIYDGISELLYGNNGFGFINTDVNKIPDCEVILKLISEIIEKPVINDKLSPEIHNRFLSIIGNNNNIGIDDYATIKKDFNNSEINKIIFYNNYDKTRLIKYYIKKNNWKIIEYDNDSIATDNTLRYALQAVGTIHSVEFKNDGPEFVLHINNDFKKKYGCFYDNCREIWTEDLLSLLFWTINITDMFNMLYIKYNNNVITKKIYINVFDHPILRKDNPKIHPFDHIRDGKTKQQIEITVIPDKPIYCWPSNNKYQDIGLPFHDIWMFLFDREFSKSFNIDSYKNFYSDKSNLIDDYTSKLNKGLFRGSFTNCVGDDYKLSNTPRIRAHIKTLQNNENFIDAYVVESNFNYINYTKGQLKSENIDFMGSRDKFMKPTEQIRYKIILNLDGFASAFRIIQEIYYNSCIIIPESDYTDVIRDCLVPWKHYVPCKGDLSNIINTIKWCTENDDKVLKILENLRKLRDEIISVENMLNLTKELIVNPSNSMNLVKLINFDIDSQQEYKPDRLPIEDDELETLGKTGKLEFIGENGVSTLNEDVFYKKYLKYKQKYLMLKNK